MSKSTAFLILSLALFISGCDFPQIETNSTGPEVTEEIKVVAPEADSIHLTLNFGVGELFLTPGNQQDNLLEGTVTYNIPTLRPNIEITGGDIILQPGESRINTFPNFNQVKNTWDLRLGTQTMALEIRAGAYQGRFDLGGLALTSLTINDGAAEVNLDFSSPNPQKMSVFTYKTGASNVNLSQLANANFASLVFESGAGNYTLDFSGEFQRDASAIIRSGMSNLTLVIPQGITATVQVNEGIANVQFPTGWSKTGTLYTQTGSGTSLTIVIEMGAGNLQVISSPTTNPPATP